MVPTTNRATGTNLAEGRKAARENSACRKPLGPDRLMRQARDQPGLFGREEEPMGDLSGKVAIVTGATAGIGRAAALALAAEGATVVVADIDVGRGEHVAKDIGDKGSTGVFIRTDVTDDVSVGALVSETVARFGGLDVAFNNAGIEDIPAPTAECTPENWRGRWRST